MAKDFSLSIIKVIKIKCKMGIICGKYCNFAAEFNKKKEDYELQ